MGERGGEHVQRALEQCGLKWTQDEQDRGVDAIVVGGGDGTVLRTLPQAVERDVPLGIIPLGTFNELARTLNVPAELEAACATIAAGKTKTIDLGRVNDVYYVNEASIGLSARIARRQTSDLKQSFGIFAVILTTLQSLRAASLFHVEIAFDGRTERFRTLQLTVANNARFGGIIERPDAAIDDGWLDLYSVEPRNWLEALGVALKVLGRDPRSGEGLRTRRSTKFVVRTHRPHRIAADGEPAGTTPATFDVVPRALRVFVP